MHARRPRRVRGGDPLPAARPGQAAAAGPLPGDRRGAGRRSGGAPPDRTRTRAGAHVLARARRPPGDGRRRSPPRPADDAQALRRGRRDPRRRRAAGGCVRADRPGAGRECGAQARGARTARPRNGRGRDDRWAVPRRPCARRYRRDGTPASASVEDRRAARGIGGLRRRARRAGGRTSPMRLPRSRQSSGCCSRSSTTCSTRPGRMRRSASRPAPTSAGDGGRTSRSWGSRAPVGARSCARTQRGPPSPVSAGRRRPSWPCSSL